MKILKKSDIPNSEGFEFLSVMADGTTKEDVVTKRKNGTHTCSYFNEMIGWTRKY